MARKATAAACVAIAPAGVPCLPQPRRPPNRRRSLEAGRQSRQPARQSRPSSAELKIDGFLPSAFSGPAAAPRKPTQDTPILSRLPVPLLVHSGDVLHYANDEFLALTGYDSVEQLAEAGGLGALFSERYDDGAQDGDDRAIRLRTRDGMEFAIEALLRSVPWNGGKALMLVVRRTGDDEEPSAARRCAAGGTRAGRGQHAGDRHRRAQGARRRDAHHHRHGHRRRHPDRQ